VLKTGPPAIAPQMLKRGNDPRRGKRVALGRDIRQRIEADRTPGIGGIKIADRMSAWDAVRHRLGKVAVRVDHGDPFPGHDVVHGQVEQDRALAGTGFSDHVNMPLAVSQRVPREPNIAPGRFRYVVLLHMPGQPQCES
jgi:hypothetical protein